MFASAILVGTLGATVSSVIDAKPAYAVGAFDNAIIADYATSKVGEVGGSCREFVNAVVLAATGLNVSGGHPNYFKGFTDAGADEIASVDDLRKGDVIQIGGTEAYKNLHTLIIVGRAADGRFNVVDSNHDPLQANKVKSYDRDIVLDTDRKAFRLGTAKPTAEPDGPDLPKGDLELVRVPGGAVVKGWALDPNTPGSPIQVHLYAGTGFPEPRRNPSLALTANLRRDDVANVWGPAYGPYHGYDAGFSLPPGPHTVCAYGMNTGAGKNRRFDCVDIYIANDPVGNVEQMYRVPGGMRVAGWALDPDTSAAIQVHVYGGGKGAATVANLPGRGDVAAHWPAYGSARGYNVFLPTPPGVQDICAYGINAAGPGRNLLLAECKKFNVINDPVGNFEQLERVPGGVIATGWALDPDTAASIQVHVYSSSAGTATVANLNRPDVGAAWPEYGNAHGFRVFLPLGPEYQTVCAYGINDLPGSYSPQLRCRAA